MPDLPYHAWTHRPKAQGGTDPIEIASGVLPVAYTFFSAKDIEDGEEYALGAPNGEFIGINAGIYDGALIYNDDAAATFMFSDEDDGVLWVVSTSDQPELFAFDANLYFATGFDGEVSLFVFMEPNYWDHVPTYTSPAVNILEEKKFVETANGDFSVHLSGVVLIDPTAYDASTSSDSAHALTMNVTQVSGSTQTIGQGWMLWTKLSGSTGLSAQHYA